MSELLSSLASIYLIFETYYQVKFLSPTSKRETKKISFSSIHLGGILSIWWKEEEFHTDPDQSLIFIIFSSIAHAIYYVSLSEEEKAESEYTFFFVCLFHLPLSLSRARFFFMQWFWPYIHAHIYSRESIAHQLHHLIYFTEEEEGKKEKRERTIRA